MNKNVIKTLLVLTILYLAVWYVLKFFFPEQFVLQISNPNLIKIGNYVDSNVILKHLCPAITSFATYYLYLGATLKQKKLNWKHIVTILIVIGLSIIVNISQFGILSYYHIFAMIILPAIFNGNSKNIAIVFSAHLLCQYLSLSIRNISSMMMCINSVLVLVMALECYAWLFLFYLYFNYKEILKNG